MAGPERCPDHGPTFTKGCEACQASRRVYQRQLRQARKAQELAEKREAIEAIVVRQPTNDPYRRVGIVEGDLAWHAEAACRNAPTDVFFPESDGRGKMMDWQAALAVCDTCPVTEPCLTYALRTNQRDGVWGGKTPGQRRRLPKPDPLCFDCGQEFPKPPAGAPQRCEPCQARWRRQEQYRWHHEVGKFRREVSA
jgi:WhiB family redox-sensing transcriptional regulator